MSELWLHGILNRPSSAPLSGPRQPLVQSEHGSRRSWKVALSWCLQLAHITLFLQMGGGSSLPPGGQGARAHGQLRADVHGGGARRSEEAALRGLSVPVSLSCLCQEVALHPRSGRHHLRGANFSSPHQLCLFPGARVPAPGGEERGRGAHHLDGRVYPGCL